MHRLLTACLVAFAFATSVAAGPTPPGTTAPPSTEASADFAGFADQWFDEQASCAIDFDLFGWHFGIDACGPGGFALLLAVAAFGGLLLNLTPCVLPVIPIKIMSLSAAAGNRRRMLVLGSAMSLGVITLWLAVGVAIAFVSGFTAINQLYQFPAFTIGVGIVIALMGFGMLGLFATRLPQFVYAFKPSHDTVGGSFAFGVMTGVLSTPCTAPFMGTAAAYATTVSPISALTIFAAIGIGMAVPYQILTSFPHLVERMPRTGPASELIKQVMGLLILAVASFFVGTGLSSVSVEAPDPPSLLFWWFVAGFGAAAGLWLVWRTVRLARSLAVIVIFGATGCAIAAASLAVGVLLTDRGPIDWIYYTPERFAQQKASGNVVVMDFTAEWCLNCKALEAQVLHQSELVDVLNGEGVAAIKVDLTGNNADGNAMLADVNRLTIPLLVVFDPAGKEAFKGDFYTAQQVRDAIDAARSGGSVGVTPTDPASDRAFDSRAHVDVSVRADRATAAPGGKLRVAVILDIDPGWHTWTNERPTPPDVIAFEGAIHTAIAVGAPADGRLVPLALRWPEHHEVQADLSGAGPETFAVFEGRTIVYLPVTVPDDAAPGATTLSVKTTFQACNDTTCLMPVFELELPLRIEIVPARGDQGGN